VPILIRGPASQPTPSQYQLAAGESFTPEAVTASFDGSGAAGGFLACLSVYAQSGELLSRTFPAEVAAGDIAKVTYAPLLRAAEQAAAVSGLPSGVSGINGFFTVPSGVPTFFCFDPGNIVSTDFPAIFAQEAAGVPGVEGLAIHATGTYAAFWCVNWTDTGAAPLANPQNFVVQAEDGSGSMFVGLPFLGSLVGRGYTDPLGGVRSLFDVGWCAVFSIHGSTAPNDPIIIEGRQSTGVDLRAYVSLMVLQISTTAFF
jgi:hypothetical protein